MIPGDAAGNGLHPVHLVGAGPGDPELLTLKAVRAIAQADVLLVDDLVDPRVLEHARPDARITRVGKRGGLRSTPQSFIDRLMVREALAGHRVVRLKGGDPLIFGRAGEELAALRAAGLQAVIVNGITSALAAAASLQLSLTHREHSHGVVFVTGHPKDGGQALEWAALARAGFTLAIYMGVARAAQLQDALLAAGLPATLPAAVVYRASGSDEQRLATTLGGLAGDLDGAGFGSPSMLLIGKVTEAALLQASAATAADGERAAGHGASAIRVTPPPPRAVRARR